MKKTMKIICILLAAIVTLTVLYFVFAFFGNPVSYLLAKRNASQFLEDKFGDSNFEIERVGYNFKTGGYYADVIDSESRDSYFSVYTDWRGQYHYDTYDGITSMYNTYYRLDNEYRQLVKSVLANGICPFNTDIVIGELRDADVIEVFTYTDQNGDVHHYTIEKRYGLHRSDLILDKEYDIRQLGASCGHIVLYIQDETLTVERAAELLLEVKTYMDSMNVPFYALGFHLCEPRNEDGQYTGTAITLFDFLYSDIYEEGLIERVQNQWNIAQEHHAIQDGLKNELELITGSMDEIIP